MGFFMTVNHGLGSRPIGLNLSQNWPKKSPAKQIKTDNIQEGKTRNFININII